MPLIPSKEITLSLMDGTERKFRPSLWRMSNVAERLNVDIAEAFKKNPFGFACDLFHEFQLGDDKLPKEDLCDLLPVSALQLVASWINREEDARPTIEPAAAIQ